MKTIRDVHGIPVIYVPKIFTDGNIVSQNHNYIIVITS